MDNVQPTNSRKREKGDAGRCTKQPSKRRYSKKRKFAGNQNTKRDGASSNIQTPVSLKKMKNIKRKKVDRTEGYRLIDIQIFEDIITSLACPECCEKTLCVEEDLTKKNGLATYISVLCECGYAKENYTSKAVINNPMSKKKRDEAFRNKHSCSVCIEELWCWSCRIGEGMLYFNHTETNDRYELQKHFQQYT